MSACSQVGRPAESRRIKLVMGTFLPDMSMNAPRGIMLRFDAEGAEAGIEFKRCVQEARLDCSVAFLLCPSSSFMVDISLRCI